jgi:integrase
MDRSKGTRFKVQEFLNPSGQTVWRVDGYRRDGVRLRENFSRIEDARSRAAALEIEWLGGEVPAMPKVTRLTHAQLGLAERAFDRLGDDGNLLAAVEFYIESGRPSATVEVPRLDDALAKFKAWVESTSTLRAHSKRALKLAAKMLSRSLGNPHVNRIDADGIEKALEKMKVSTVSKDVYRRGWSRFFSWCRDRPQRWITHNPVSAVKMEKAEPTVPVILTVDQSRRLMGAAENVGGGRMVHWFALCLFGGLRPAEAARIAWDQINLDDGEIRLEGPQTKDGRSRVVAICQALRSWLTAYRNTPVAYSRRIFRDVVQASGLGEWKQDVLRHTAASHRLRETGSYARVADEFGNSESMLKKHYAGRVSTKDTKEFYGIRPVREGVGK